MEDEAFRHTVWSRLERSLATGGSVEDHLRAAVLMAGDLIGVAGSYSLSTVLHGHLFTVATTDREAWEADQVEYDTEAGPCVQALRHGEQTVVPDLEQERRWPAWSSVSTMLGFRSAAGVPATIEGGDRLALNLYAPELDAFSGGPLRRAELFTEELARTLPTALRLAEHVQMTNHLQEALASRSTIDQALGVLMAQNRCTRDEAFGILRRASQHRNLKLREIAATVIERFTGHPAAEPPPFRPPTPSSTRSAPAPDGSRSDAPRPR
jgi:GAF domain-containing protein